MLRLFRNALKSDSPFPMSKNLLDDLELTAYLRRYFANPVQFVTCDADAIRERNEICEALLKNESITTSLERLYSTSLPFLEPTSLSFVSNDSMQVIGNMIGVRHFWDAVQAVIEAIESCGQLPPVLAELPGKLNELLSVRYALNFEEAWDKYASGVGKARSMAYQIQFSEDLTIETFALVNVNIQRYTSSTLLDRLRNSDNPMRVGELQSLAPPPVDYATKTEASTLQRFSNSVRKMLFAQTASVKSQLNIIERGIAEEIRIFVEELQFALGMVQYAQTISKHAAHICYAEIREPEERSLIINKMVHPYLAEQADVITNDLSISEGREFILLGGVNRGGKTTYLRTAGAIQFLYQMGLPIPAASAQISPVSGMFSVFSREESTELLQGTLGRELSELRDAIAALDDHALFLGNEPISGTSPMESYLLSREALCILKSRHVRGIWVTHLYELFEDTEKLNKLNFGSKFACMHTEAIDAGRRFNILPGIPQKYSGAREVFAAAGAQ